MTPQLPDPSQPHSGDGSRALADARRERRVQTEVRRLVHGLRTGKVASLKEALAEAQREEDFEREEAVLRVMEKSENEDDE